MPQRYYIINAQSGCNLAQAYADTVPGSPSIVGPSQLAELGLKAGVRFNGNLNTTWMFVNTNTLSPVVNAGTAVPISTSTFVVQSGTSTLNGTSLVNMAASVPGGLWVEISGATLNLSPAMAGIDAPMSDEEVKHLEAVYAAAHPELPAAAADHGLPGTVHAGSAQAAATTATPHPGAHAPAPHTPAHR